MPTHATAAILAIGDELILGQKLDTNSKWLSERLLDLGVRPTEHATVDDDLEQLAGAIKRLSRHNDLVITTGGLGPTADDLSRPALALATEDELIEDPEALEEIRAWYKSRDREMPEANRSQALRPTRASYLRNNNGTAPGLHAEHADTTILALPGPPSEMRPMFAAWAASSLSPSADRVTLTRVLQSFGNGESNIAGILGDLMARDRDPLVGTTASTGVVSIRIRSERASTLEQAERDIDATISEVKAKLQNIIYADNDTPLPVAVSERLRERGQTVATAESCTGGLLSQMITAIPNSSEIFQTGWITYSNETKAAQLGVSPNVFQTVGAVSRECAMQMAEGALQRSNADHALSITGIAGPTGDTPEKPVGTVYIALASRNADTDTRRFQFMGSREQIRLWSANTALGMLRLRLDQIEMSLLAQSEEP